MGVMLGSFMVQREERQFRSGICQQIEVIPEVPAITGRIPPNRAIWLRETTIAVAIKDAILPAITGVVGTKTGRSNNGSAITGNMEIGRFHLTATDGFVQEASAEDLKEQPVGFLIRSEGCL